MKKLSLSLASSLVVFSSSAFGQLEFHNVGPKPGPNLGSVGYRFSSPINLGRPKSSATVQESGCIPVVENVSNVMLNSSEALLGLKKQGMTHVREVTCAFDEKAGEKRTLFQFVMAATEYGEPKGALRILVDKTGKETVYVPEFSGAR